MLNNLLQMNLSEAISNQIKLGILTIVRQEVTNVTSLIFCVQLKLPKTLFNFFPLLTYL